MWSIVICLTCLLFLSGCGAASQPNAVPQNAAGGSTPGELPREGTVEEPVPVARNRSVHVPDGFRGIVHALFDERTILDVTAQWTPCSFGRAFKEGTFWPRFHRNFRALRPAVRERAYSARDFSGFLPNEFESAGQVWSLDEQSVLGFLRQFHPHASLKLRAAGRRAGPDGAFGILRATSSEYLDIAFRIHAEFNVTPFAWYTPAYFSGRMLVNRKAGTVDSFHLNLPKNQPLNATLTVRAPQAPKFVFFDIVRVEQMELSGGDPQLYEGIEWTDELTLADAQDKLRSIFYKFFDIKWVSVEQAREIARIEQKPILAMVLWGSLDDQSC